MPESLAHRRPCPPPRDPGGLEPCSPPTSFPSGGIRNTFEAVPDAPATKFVLEMQGGNKGLLENSTNLCRSTNRAVAKLTAQNGKVSNTEPVVTNSCGKKGKKGKLHREHR